MQNPAADAGRITPAGWRSSKNAGSDYMKRLFELRGRTRSLISWSVVAMLVCGLQPGASADTIPVRHVVGTIHGFLELRSDDGRVVASGDVVQVVHGDLVTARTIFTFKDGSIDDETTVFSQRRSFHLVTDHHVQKGPAFPHPTDVLIDSRSGQVTVHSTGKDGKDEVKTDHLTLPPDLANGMVAFVIENIKPDAAVTTVPMLVLTPKPRVVKLIISPRGEENFSVIGTSHKALHYEIKIDLGGVVGVVAPLIGKAPPNIEVWSIGGEAPTFVREQGPIYAEGPIMTIQLTSPVWGDAAKPDAPKPGN
jgi:hypothetical protein